MDGACAGRSSGRWRVVVVPSGTRCPTSHYGLVAHFPSCSPVVVVVVVAHVFEQRVASPCLFPLVRSRRTACGWVGGAEAGENQHANAHRPSVERLAAGADGE